jgi:hypothetical protein
VVPVGWVLLVVDERAQGEAALEVGTELVSESVDWLMAYGQSLGRDPTKAMPALLPLYIVKPE